MTTEKADRFVRVRPSTKFMLRELGKKGESYDKVIRKQIGVED
jgi:hypothetical protein